MKNSNFVLFAHRGASGYAPENTLKAFSLALEMGMKAFEFDVQQSRDGSLVIHHDYNLHNGRLIKDLTFGEIKTVKPDICTLEETLALFNNGETVNVEIKNETNPFPLIAEKTAAVIKNLNEEYQNRIIVSSFHFDTLKKTRALLPEIKLGFLNSNGKFQSVLKLASSIYAFSINLSGRFITEEKIRAAHDNGFKVFVYTINEKEQALKLKAIGADGIFTNYPDILNK